MDIMGKIAKTYKGRRLNLFILSMFILLFVGIISYYRYIYSITEEYKNAIYPGVNIENIDMGGKTQAEAMELLNEKYDKPLKKSSINVKVKDTSYNLSYEQLNIKYNIDEIVHEAFLFGKNLNLYKKYKLISNVNHVNYNLTCNYKKEPIKHFLENIDKSLPKEIQDSSIRKNNEGFHVTEEKIKEEINIDQGLKEITDRIENRIFTIDLEIPINYINPRITAKELKTIDSIIASFKTKFALNDRATNIMLATKGASNVLVMPGETYSFNELVGARTPDKGYKEAPVIRNKRLEQDFGGGVCQVSTTLHNAVLRAGIIPIERMHHSMPVAYVPKGTDATVFYNAVDYKFINTLNYPIYVNGYILNDEVVFEIYSNSTLKAKTYDIVSEVYKEVPRKIKYIKDLSLDEGEEFIDNKGSDEFKVRVYRIVYENGRQISKGLIYDDHYKSVDKIIKRNL
jgi:vancomycin resistance protein YoaR